MKLDNINLNLVKEEVTRQKELLEKYTITEVNEIPNATRGIRAKQDREAILTVLSVMQLSQIIRLECDSSKVASATYNRLKQMTKKINNMHYTLAKRSELNKHYVYIQRND